MDWKKEIKLSDLVKRSSKAPKDEAVQPEQQPAEAVQAAAPSEAAAAQVEQAPTAAEAEQMIFVSVAPPAEEKKKSALKKEISLFKRGPKEPKAAKKQPAAPAEAPAGDGAGGRKKRIQLSALFKKPARAPKADRAPKLGRKSKGKSAGPLPGIPLMRAFNLLPKEDARQAHRRPAPAKLILVAVGVVLIAGLALGYTIMNARVSDKEAVRDDHQAELDQLNAELAALASDDLEAGEATAIQQEQQARTAALSIALTPRIAWDRVLRDISLVLPEDVWLQGIIAGPSTTVTTAAAAGATPAGAYTVTLSGTTRAQDGVAHFLSRLEVLPDFTAVTLIGSNRIEVGGEEVVQFSIAATLKDQGGAVS